MQTKSKVFKVSEVYRTFMGRTDQMYVHYIWFENGQHGEFISSSSSSAPFIVDAEVEYIATEKENYSGKKFTEIKLPGEKPSGPRGSTGSSQKRADRDEGVITALSCISSATNLLHNKVHPATAEEVIEAADKFFNWAVSKSTKK